jgi:hypothetical protein
MFPSFSSFPLRSNPTDEGAAESVVVVVVVVLGRRVLSKRFRCDGTMGPPKDVPNERGAPDAREPQ